MKLTRSEFLRSPAEYLIKADDDQEPIELLRYKDRQDVIVPLSRFSDPSTQEARCRIYDSKDGNTGSNAALDCGAVVESDPVGYEVIVRRLSFKEATDGPWQVGMAYRSSCFIDASGAHHRMDVTCPHEKTRPDDSSDLITSEPTAWVDGKIHD